MQLFRDLLTLSCQRNGQQIERLSLGSETADSEASWGSMGCLTHCSVTPVSLSSLLLILCCLLWLVTSTDSCVVEQMPPEDSTKLPSVLRPIVLQTPLAQTEQNRPL